MVLDQRCIYWQINEPWPLVHIHIKIYYKGIAALKIRAKTVSFLGEKGRSWKVTHWVGSPLFRQSLGQAILCRGPVFSFQPLEVVPTKGIKYFWPPRVTTLKCTCSHTDTIHITTNKQEQQRVSLTGTKRRQLLKCYSFIHNSPKLVTTKKRQERVCKHTQSKCQK